MKVKETKKDTVRRHLRMRAKERFDIDLTREMEDNIIDGIYSGEYQVVERQSIRVSLYDVVIDDNEVRVAYDHKRRQLITVLFRNQSEYDELSKEKKVRLPKSVIADNKLREQGRI